MLKTFNAVSPIVTGWTPLLAIVVWEVGQQHPLRRPGGGVGCAQTVPVLRGYHVNATGVGSGKQADASSSLLSPLLLLCIARYVPHCSLLPPCPLMLTSPPRPACACPNPPILLLLLLQHAYYLDHQNRRADYISIFLDHLVAWDVVEERYAASLRVEGSA